MNDQGIIVPYDDEGWPGHLRCATLLATVAQPPRFQGDPLHEQLVAAFCRLHTHALERTDPSYARSPQYGTFVPRHWTFDIREAERLVVAARRILNRRLGASHVLLPFVWEALERAGIPIAKRSGPGTSLSNIERTVRHEADRIEALEAKLGRPVERRFPMGGQQIADKGFMTDVLKPARPVLHLVCALDHVMDDFATVARQRLTPAQAEAFDIDVRGPQLTGIFLENQPALADQVAKLSSIYEVGLPHLRLQRPDPAKVVRLRPPARGSVVRDEAASGRTNMLH